MMDVLILHYRAPMMRFGGVVVDGCDATYEIPNKAAVVGLIANALGIDRREYKKLTQLHESLSYAVACQDPGRKFVDYTTVDYTTPWMDSSIRKGGANTTNQIFLRSYLADAHYVIAIHGPNLDQIKSALDRPARPLFLGRKTCLPSHRIAGEIVEADSLKDALKRVLYGECTFWEECLEYEPGGFEITRDKDWSCHLHGGRIWIRKELIQGDRDEPAPSATALPA